MVLQNWDKGVGRRQADGTRGGYFVQQRVPPPANPPLEACTRPDVNPRVRFHHEFLLICVPSQPHATKFRSVPWVGKKSLEQGCQA